jgi:hypothetical protein
MAQTSGLPVVKEVEYQKGKKVWFARYGQFQLKFDFTAEKTPFGLPQVKDQDLQIEKLKNCLDTAVRYGLNVAIFPELTVSLKKGKRKKMVRFMEKVAADNDMIIVAGTFYDDNGSCKNAVVLPTGTVYSYKIRPSIFESSPLYGEGMAFGDTLFLFRTKYGNFMPLVCVDLISDDANYTVRNLANKRELDMLVNINFNPKSQEFMREASAMTVRHPLFVSITNVCCYGEVKKYSWDEDEYGNTSVFGSVDQGFKEKVAKSLPPFYTVTDTVSGENGIKKVVVQTHPAYKSMLGIVDPGREALLLYDINLRLIHTPQENNAPDQGYPVIKNIRTIDLAGSVE